MKEDIYILYTESIKDLFTHFYKNGIQGSIKTQSKSLIFDEMRLINDKKTMIIKRLVEDEVDNQIKEFDTQEKWNHYEQVKNIFYNQCFSRNYISYYSPNVKDMLNLYTRANLVGSFGETNCKGTFREWDKNKYYTSIPIKNNL